ncbi:hypothetical protein VNO77_18864 [Canavalia gladiata]|uniref:Uncharacterized protein n=1 Tax=Canavalia gladiata TaxID=3824 RepID=A0AAN9LLH1_CANGL
MKGTKRMSKDSDPKSSFSRCQWKGEASSKGSLAASIAIWTTMSVKPATMAKENFDEVALMTSFYAILDMLLYLVCMSDYQDQHILRENITEDIVDKICTMHMQEHLKSLNMDNDNNNLGVIASATASNENGY